jgi:plasmid replication initiation protein
MNLRVMIGNNLVDLACHLSLNENRLIMYAVTQLGADIEEELSISLADCAALYGMDRSTCRAAFKKAADSLYSRNIVLADDPKKRKIRWLQVGSEVVNGYITVQFSSPLAPQLVKLKEKFTIYNLINAADFRLSHTWKLYLKLMQWQSIGKYKPTPDQFREDMKLSDYYAGGFGRMRTKVINPALNEINKKTKLTVTFEVEKKGPKIVKLIFTYKSVPEPQTEILNLHQPAPKTSPEQLAKNAQRAEHLAEITRAITLAKNAGEPIDKFIPKRLIELAKPFLKAEKETVTTI